jgi:hypothetical protein
MGVRRRLKRLGALDGTTFADFLAALGEPDSVQPWEGARLALWSTWRGSLPVVFDTRGRFVKVTKL